MKHIKLTKGYYAIVDNSDYEFLNEWKWQSVIAGTKIYAGRNPGHGGKSRYISMHRFIMQAPKGMCIDHIDGNGLNNQRSNLRLCTRSQNLWNTGLNKTNQSGLKGVSWNKQNKCWRARYIKDGREIHLGGFHNPIEAAKAYDLAIIIDRGDFAVTNQSLGIITENQNHTTT